MRLKSPIQYGAFKITKTPKGLRWWIKHIEIMLKHEHSNKAVLKPLLIKYKQHLQLFKKHPELWKKGLSLKQK